MYNNEIFLSRDDEKNFWKFNNNTFSNIEYKGALYRVLYRENENDLVFSLLDSINPNISIKESLNNFNEIKKIVTEYLNSGYPYYLQNRSLQIRLADGLFFNYKDEINFWKGNAIYLKHSTLKITVKLYDNFNHLKNIPRASKKLEVKNIINYLTFIRNNDSNIFKSNSSMIIFNYTNVDESVISYYSNLLINYYHQGVPELIKYIITDL